MLDTVENGRKSKRRMLARRLLLSLIFIFFLLIAGAAYFYENIERYVWPDLVPPASYWVDDSKPLRAQTVNVEIAGRHFRIPKIYVQSKLPLNGTIRDRILLRVIWPDMKSIYDLKDRPEYLRVFGQEHRIGDILLEAADERPSLDKMVANRRQFLSKEGTCKAIGNLECREWFSGLKESPELDHVVFLENNKLGTIKNFIECKIETHFIVSPGCKHRFVDRGVFFDLYYNKEKFFPQWQEQRQRAINFIESMEVETEKPSVTKGE